MFPAPSNVENGLKVWVSGAPDGTFRQPHALRAVAQCGGVVGPVFPDAGADGCGRDVVLPHALVQDRLGSVTGEVVVAPWSDQPPDLFRLEMTFQTPQDQSPDVSDVDPRPKDRQYVGVFKLWQGLWEFEITDTHASSLTVENWFYKGGLSGLREFRNPGILRSRRRVLET